MAAPEREACPVILGNDELAELRQRVDCRTVLERAGWRLDVRESTRSAAKYRQDSGRIVIVTHDGRGWFAPLDDRRGDVIALAQHVWGGTLGHARKALRPLAGITPTLLPMRRDAEVAPFDGEAAWRLAQPPCPGSAAWAYLNGERGLPVDVLVRVIQVGVLREGVCGTLWAQHQASTGRISGWEMRGPRYKGFSKGGTKTLFWLGHPSVADRLAVTESAIDAMSLAALEGWQEGTVYASTGGGYGPETEMALRGLLPPGAELVVAVDRGAGGEALTVRLEGLAQACGVRSSLLRPDAKDWNDQLRGRYVQER